MIGICRLGEPITKEGIEDVEEGERVNSFIMYDDDEGFGVGGDDQASSVIGAGHLSTQEAEEGICYVIWC